jgi:hypothetical protein
MKKKQGIKQYLSLDDTVKAIQAFLQSQQMKYVDVARLLCVSPGLVRRWDTGERQMPLLAARALEWFGELSPSKRERIMLKVRADAQVQ